MPRTALALGAAVALLHALTLPSGLYWMDAGDFATASCDLGVPHPTGFPLYVLLGKLTCMLPIGSAAFRMGLYSALASGVLTALLAALFLRLAPPGLSPAPRLAALSVGLLALWTAPVAALAARTPDVYALQACLVLGAVLLCLGMDRDARPPAWLALGLVLGLGLSNHAEYRLFGPILLGAALLRTWPRPPATRRGRRQAGRLLVALAGLTAGLLPYAYLPLAAARAPYHDWGEPDTWARFWDHVTGRSIRVAFGDQVLGFSPPRLEQALRTLGGQLLGDFGALLVVAAVGAWMLTRRRPSLERPARPATATPARPAAFAPAQALWLVLALMAVDLGYSAAINPMGLEDLQDGLVTWALLAVLIASGLAGMADWLVRTAPDRPAWRRRGLLGGAAVAVVAALLARAPWDRLLLQQSWGPEDLCAEALLGAPEGALVLTGTEAMAAARTYLVGVGALRPDLQVLHRPEASDARLLLQRQRQGPFPLASPAEAARWAAWGPGARLETYLDRLSTLTQTALAEGRTVLWGTGAADETRGLWDRLEPGFPLHRLVASADQARAALRPPSGLLPEDRPEWREPWGARWASEYLNYLGTLYIHVGHLDWATQAYDDAHRHAPDWSAPLVNLGVLAARAGDFEEAARLAAGAVQRDPLNATAWLNLARYRCVLGQTEDAHRALERGRALRPDHPSLDEVEAFLARCPPTQVE